MRIQEWSDLLAEVNGLIHSHLGSILLVFIENHGHCLHVFPVVIKAELKFRASDIWRLLVVADLWQELMKGLNALWAEDLVKDLNFVRELVADLQETLWELSDVHESNFQVLSQVWVLVLSLKPVDHESNDSWQAILINLVDDLFLAIKVN